MHYLILRQPLRMEKLISKIDSRKPLGHIYRAFLFEPIVEISIQSAGIKI